MTDPTANATASPRAGHAPLGPAARAALDAAQALGRRAAAPATCAPTRRTGPITPPGAPPTTLLHGPIWLSVEQGSRNESALIAVRDGAIPTPSRTAGQRADCTHA